MRRRRADEPESCKRRETARTIDDVFARDPMSVTMLHSSEGPARLTVSASHSGLIPAAFFAVAAGIFALDRREPWKSLAFGRACSLLRDT